MAIPFEAAADSGRRRVQEIHLSFYLEKVAGEGEDSEPLLMVGYERFVVAVFDGMGGAGGTVYDTPGGRHSGAWFASRVAREVVQGHIGEIVGPGPDVDGPRTAALLHERLRAALGRRLAEFGAGKSSLRSKLLRALPTTMAMAYAVRADSDGSDFVCHCFWAGDSRVYVLDPEAGAHQLSSDDLRSGHDALQNLVDDSVMDNCISADTDFRINVRRVDLRAPFILLAATDGCFGYVPSPMHFEHLILSHLQGATSVDGWREGLRSSIEAVAGDDATLALLAVGGDFEEIRQLFRRRHEQVRRTYIEPIDTIDEQMRKTERQADELRHRRLALRAELWTRYKPDYERYLAALTESAAPSEAAAEPAVAPPPNAATDAAADAATDPSTEKRMP